MDRGKFNHHDEQILAVAPVRMKAGIFSSENYNLVLTNKRFIFAIYNAEMLKKEASVESQKSMEEGRSIWGRIYSLMGTRAAYHKRYLVMRPQEILAENNDNFYCVHELINQIELKKSRNLYDSEGEYKGEEAGRILIKTVDLSYKLDVESFVDIAEFRSHLKSIFTHRYKER